MTPEMQQQLRIRQLVENWAVYRDAGLWDRFRTVWHDDGVMMATWFQGPFEDFIRVTIEGWNKGVSILHFLGGSAIDVQGTRAIAQTKMTISQRGLVEGCLCDVVCTGRFYDFFEERDGRWGLVHRQPIYEKDRIDPVDSAAVVKLDQQLVDLVTHQTHLQVKEVMEELVDLLHQILVLEAVVEQVLQEVLVQLLLVVMEVTELHLL
jgi:hypothetical protein